MEVYKVCFESYEISNFGNLRKKTKAGKYINIKGSINNRGYRYFQVQRDGKRINNLFHHMVSNEFIGKRPNGLIVDHIDQDKLNNNVDNLRYTTHTENMRNCKRYKDDIEEKDKALRHKIIQKRLVMENINSKRFKCEICPQITKLSGVFASRSLMEKHNHSKRHIHRVWVIGEMKKYNIPVNLIEYSKLKYKVNDYTCGKRKNKPEIYWT